MNTAGAADNGKMIIGAGRAERYDLSHPNARRGRDAAKKFIPDGDSDFARMARQFAQRLVDDPAKYHVELETAREIAEAVEAYRAALAANLDRVTKSLATVLRKDGTRAVAERLIREAANRIRVNKQIDPLAKGLVKLKERAARPKRRECPQTPPALTFVGPVPYSNTADGKHVIRFRDPFGRDGTSAKPHGATRIELYVDLVPPGEAIPSWPGVRWGGRTWYLRSFTRSPMTVEYPKCDGPMRVVYWARWADATGKQGPWSPTLATRVEGYDLAVRAARQLGQRPHEQTIIITSGVKQLPAVSAVEPPDLVDVNRIDDERRMLPDETAEAA
jgi:hypothetical protein